MRIQDHVRGLIEATGDDFSREGLRDTPDRVARSFKEIYAGYDQDPREVFTYFEVGEYSEMVILKQIEFYSFCEHHMLPFIGHAHIGYLPHRKIVGISKLARLLEIYARRLQIQERICTQVTAAIMDHLKPMGAACIIEAKHLCIACRGVQKQNSVMITSSLEGVFREKESVRAEFLSLIK